MHKERKFTVKHAILHTPFILAGTNFNTKLDALQHGDKLTLTYDRDDQELVVVFRGPKGTETAIIPITNVAVMIEAGVPRAQEPVVIQRAGTEITAQVETPQSHVEGGLGKGKTGQEKGKYR